MLDYNCDQCGEPIQSGPVVKATEDGQPKYFHAEQQNRKAQLGESITPDCTMDYSVRRMQETGVGTFFEPIEFSEFERLVQLRPVESSK